LRLQAEGVADKIRQFIKEIEAQLAWTTELPLSSGSIVELPFDVLRRWPSAVTELSQLDSSGKQQLKVSRVCGVLRQPNRLLAGVHIGYGERGLLRPGLFAPPMPYMTLALARTQRDAGVSIAEIDVKFVYDIVACVKFGQAYVIDAQGSPGHQHGAAQ
jgi:hypothetical protein